MTANNLPTRASKLAASLAKLGLRTQTDFILHLPMRYIDETAIMSMQQAALCGGQSLQVEGMVTACDVQYRPRRQLVVTLADGSGQLVLRFLNFYGSQLTQMAPGTRIRARGELKHGFFGSELVHPEYRIVNESTPLPTQLTPAARAACISGFLTRAREPRRCKGWRQQNVVSKVTWDAGSGSQYEMWERERGMGCFEERSCQGGNETDFPR